MYFFIICFLTTSLYCMQDINDNHSQIQFLPTFYTLSNFGRVTVSINTETFARRIAAFKGLILFKESIIAPLQENIQQALQIYDLEAAYGPKATSLQKMIEADCTEISQRLTYNQPLNDPYNWNLITPEKRAFRALTLIVFLDYIARIDIHTKRMTWGPELIPEINRDNLSNLKLYSDLVQTIAPDLFSVRLSHLHNNILSKQTEQHCPFFPALIPLFTTLLEQFSQEYSVNHKTTLQQAIEKKCISMSYELSKNRQLVLRDYWTPIAKKILVNPTIEACYQALVLSSFLDFVIIKTPTVTYTGIHAATRESMNKCLNFNTASGANMNIIDSKGRGPDIYKTI